MERKEWAVKHLPQFKETDPHMATIVFGNFDGREVRDTLLNIIRKNIGTQKKVNDNRYLWGGAAWRYEFDGDV
jgi:hypothetical protein